MLVWQIIKKVIQNYPVDFNKWPLKRPSAIIGQNRESQKTLNKFLIPGEICNEAVKPPWTRQSLKYLVVIGGLEMKIEDCLVFRALFKTAFALCRCKSRPHHRYRDLAYRNKQHSEWHLCRKWFIELELHGCSYLE